MKKVTIVGGGTGTYTVLQGLKNTPINLSVIVSMADSGGSNRVLRDEFGLLPTSDLRQCLVALASESSSQTLRSLFTYRYSQGTGISGMTFGNLFMAALTDILGSQKQAILETCRILDVKGQIIPVTYEKSNLVAHYTDGHEVLGEHEIDEPDNRAAVGIDKLYIFPSVKANPDAINAIAESKVIVLGPGDLFTSIISNLVVDGVSQAILKSKAKVVYITNLMTRGGQTLGFSAFDHVREINKYLGKDRVDIVVVNTDFDLPRSALDWYKKVKTQPVRDDLKGKFKGQIVRAKLVAKDVYAKHPADKLVRSLIRHDSQKLARVLMKLI